MSQTCLPSECICHLWLSHHTWLAFIMIHNMTYITAMASIRWWLLNPFSNWQIWPYSSCLFGDKFYVICDSTSDFIVLLKQIILQLWHQCCWSLSLFPVFLKLSCQMKQTLTIIHPSLWPAASSNRCWIKDIIQCHIISHWLPVLFTINLLRKMIYKLYNHVTHWNLCKFV